MISFSEYLHKHAYADTTIVTYDNGVTKFLSWCKQKRYEVDQLNYKQCKEYLTYLNTKKGARGSKLKAKTVNHQLGILKAYFNYLVFTDQHYNNPLANTSIKDVKRKFYHQLLTSSELEDLYHNFETLDVKKPRCKSVAIRNKVFIGLAVFQGLTAKELKRIKVGDVNLNRGRVKVAGTRKSNGRTLDLNGGQSFILMQYLQTDRAILQKRINCESDALFPMNTDRISCLTTPVFKELKKLNLRVTNLKQIRASVITQWVMKCDLRTAQVKAGHRYISTTESYIENDHTEMHEEISMFHPIQ